MKKRTIVRVVSILLSFAFTAACGNPATTATRTTAQNTLAEVPNTGPKGLPLYDPQGFCFDPQGNLYVADRNIDKEQYRVIKLSPTGQVLTEWHLFKRTYNIGSNGPTGVACDRQGNIYVADTSENRILWLSPAGKLLAKWGSQGDQPGQFDGFTSLALDPQGNLFVSEYNNHRIEKFSPTGKLLAVLAKPYGNDPDELEGPIDLGIGAQGDIYVVDQRNNRIMHLSSNGKFIGMWGQLGSNPGQFNQPGGMAIDKQGNIYIADDNNNRIQKFTPTGTLLAVWGNPIKNVVHFNQGPGPLVLSPEGLIYTTDTGPNDTIWHIIKISPSGKLLGP